MDALFFGGRDTPVKGTRIDGLFYGANNPPSIDQQIEKARYFSEINAVVRDLLKIKRALWHFDFKIKGADSWLKGKNGKTTNLAVAKKVAMAAWKDLLSVNNVLAIWMEGRKRPSLFLPEHTEYSDEFGEEKLVITKGIDFNALKSLPNLTPEERKGLNDKKLIITRASKVFGFEVLKDGRLGSGYERPGMASIFDACSQYQSLAVRDSVLAGAVGRQIIEQHLIGHEIKGGTHAGSRAHFCTDAKAKAVKDSLNNKIGFFRMITNFDHAIKYPAPDPNVYDGKKFDSATQRIGWLFSAIYNVVIGKNFNPSILNCLKAQAKLDRDMVGDFLKQVLVASMKAPEEIEFKWGDRIFNDPRLMTDLLKFGLSAGPVSQETYLNDADLDEEMERKRKAKEANMPEGQTMPLYDAHHGPPGKDKKSGPRRGTPKGGGK